MAHCNCSSCSCHSHTEDSHNHEHKNEKVKKIMFAAGTVVFVCAVVLQLVKISVLPVVLYAVAYILIGFDNFCELFEGLREKDFFGETTLMTVSSLGAMIIGEMAEGCMVMLLFAAGEMLEEKAAGRSKRNIAQLLSLKPKFAVRLSQSGTEEMVLPEKLCVGDIVIVKAGDTIPCDGVVLSGNADADTSSITGEGLPRALSAGDSVRCGYISLDGALKIRVTAAYADNTFSKILEIVAGNSEKKSRSESFVKKFARIYTPGVMISALLVMVLGSIITGNMGTWIYRGLVFLATSCPCAFVISVPLTFFFGIGEMSRTGLLVKGSEYVEKLSKVRVFAFDKTGTITRGKLTVVNTVFSAGVSEQEALSLCASLESCSNHPLAEHIVSYVREKGITVHSAENVSEIPGVGVSGLVLGKRVFAGSIKGIAENVDFTLSENTAKVYICADEKTLGVIELSDEIRPEAPDVIKALGQLNVKRTVMLSGDTIASAENTARLCGIGEVYAELLPQEKSALLGDITESCTDTVAFVGDGINDAPVLALADVGIAMGGEGAQIAVETADAVLLGSSLDALVRALKTARSVMSRVRFNVIFAISIKLAILLLSLVGFANMWIAVFGDVGVTMLVILNSLRKFRV